MNRHVCIVLTAVACLSFRPAPFARDAADTQDAQSRGRAIGTISTRGDLIVFELDENALGRANMFDLERRTVRFVPAGSGYRVENTALRWDEEPGAEMTDAQVSLRNFSFPFSGRTWDTFSVGVTGSIAFGAPVGGPPGGRGAGAPGGGRGGGVTIGRFEELQKAAPRLVNLQPAICVFMKPRMSGTRHVKELADRVVITWSLTEPAAGIQDFTWAPTVNRFQAVLHKDGTVEMSYDQMAARDAIVGIYPVVSADAANAVAPRPIAPPGLQSPQQDLSSLTRQDGPFATVFEPFHYLALPNPRDLTCTVIGALGDHFDFLAYYSDFRIDNQEAGTPSTGPRGGGPDGGAVTGVGATERNLASYCTAGRFQWQFVQPVYVGSNQMQERPPDGIIDTSPRNIIHYAQQIGERTRDRRLLPYNYGISQIAHEMGHRWSAFVSARVGSETIALGPTHWARGLHAPAAFPFQRPTEASAMGGGVWQDNFDGTFTQLDDDYYVPATGWSHLELYLMGLIAASEVPDFFILRNLSPAGRDAAGRPVFTADRTKVTIDDVIAVEGPRLPDVDRAQKQFNTGIVVMVEHGKAPSQALLDRAAGIRAAWIEYFTTTTGHRASMRATIPK